uniref:Transmembrane protein n=1 Tax=Ditylenchus dipsaci TaxID=166011 RepID=A0A915D9T2_9BILA
MVQKSILSYLLILALTLQKLCNAVVVANEMGSNKIMMIVSSDQHVTDNNDTVAEMTEIGILFGSETSPIVLICRLLRILISTLLIPKSVEKNLTMTSFQLVLFFSRQKKSKELWRSRHCIPFLSRRSSLEKPELRPVDVAFRLGFVLFILLFCTFLMMSAFEEEELQSAKHSEWLPCAM